MSSLGVCYNGKRKVLKVTPTTVLQAVLEEACDFYSLDSKHCRLKKGRNFVDLSLPFRFANLPSNSSVDIDFDEVAAAAESTTGTNVAASSKPAAKCRIALSVEGAGSMPTTVFPVTHSLLDLVTHFVQEGKVPASAIAFGDAGADVIYLQSRFRGTQLAATTLGGLGLAGQAARLQLRLPQQQRQQQQQDVGEAKDKETTLAPGPVPVAGGELQSITHDAHGADAKGVVSAGLMDVDKDTQTFFSSPSPSPSPSTSAPASAPAPAPAPAHGDGAAELRALIDENFDAVSRPALVTLSKYVFNVYASPLEPKFRVIFTDNRTFGERVAPCRAALLFLAAVGFVSDSVSGRQALRLPIPPIVAGSEDQAALLVRPVVAALQAAMHECNVPIDERPTVVDRAKLLAARQQQQQQQQQQPVFDPYKTMVRRVADVNPDGSVSMAGTFSSGRGSSTTDARLTALAARREELEGFPGDAFAEPTYVVLPRLDSDPSLSTGTGSGSGNGGSSNMGGEEIDTAEGGDGRLLAAAMARTLRNKSEDAPLTTAAIRAVKKAESELVYCRTLVRVRFPDRMELQRCLHPRHTMREVYAWVRDCLQSPQLGQQVELYITPPRQLLQADGTTLATLRLVPAVLLNVTWVGLPPGAGASYIRPELLAAASVASVVGIPAGIPLVPAAGAKAAGVSSSSFSSSSSSFSSSSEAPAKKAKSGKPSWLKI